MADQRQPKEFNNLKPEKDITDPDGLANAGPQFPRHVYRAVAAPVEGDEPLENAVIVAWRGKAPVYNVFAVVGSEAELQDQIAAGYSDKPVVPDAPAADGKKKKKGE
jgi:hypothetical protein